MSDSKDFSESKDAVLLLDDVTAFFGSNRSTLDYIAQIKGKNPRHFEVLYSLEAHIASISQSVLLLLKARKQTEAEILYRSVLQAHWKFLRLLTHRHAPDVSFWEFENCLPIATAKADQNAASKVLKRIPEDHVDWPNIKKMHDNAIKIRKRLGKLRHPKTGRKIDEKQLFNIKEAWEPTSVIIDLATEFPERHFGFHLDDYREASKQSHISAERFPMLQTAELIFPH
ncbi:MAG: hypothetical protein HKO04_03800 [Silicimonas sp.]|nr:hypothetical protein [Silicimonas sp.]